MHQLALGIMTSILQSLVEWYGTSLKKWLLHSGSTLYATIFIEARAEPLTAFTCATVFYRFKMHVLSQCHFHGSYASSHTTSRPNLLPLCIIVLCRQNVDSFDMCCIFPLKVYENCYLYVSRVASCFFLNHWCALKSLFNVQQTSKYRNAHCMFTHTPLSFLSGYELWHCGLSYIKGKTFKGKTFAFFTVFE